MQHILTVQQTESTEKELILFPIEEWPQQEWDQLKDGERMLADSAALTFVYVLDHEDGFVQLRLPKGVWPALREAYEQNKKVVVRQQTEIELAHFKEEMDYLLDNIPGNSNYGEDMVQAVEEQFEVADQ